MHITIIGDQLPDSQALSRLCSHLVTENEAILPRPENMQLVVRRHHHVPLGLGRAMSITVEAEWDDGSYREVEMTGDHLFSILPMAIRALAASRPTGRAA